jgi:hypothetical protein
MALCDSGEIRGKIIKLIDMTNSTKKTQLPGQQAYVIVFFLPGIPIKLKKYRHQLKIVFIECTWQIEVMK